MKLNQLLLSSVMLASLSISTTNAEDKPAADVAQVPMMSRHAMPPKATTPPQMPMMNSGQGQAPMMGMNARQGKMPMMNMTAEQGKIPVMMQKQQGIMQAHMKKMEEHSANIEALLRELVELQKTKQ